MYKLNTGSVTRLSDGAIIPLVPGNRDYNEYLEWVADGNTPELSLIDEESESIKRLAEIDLRLKEIDGLKIRPISDITLGSDVTFAKNKLELLEAEASSLRAERLLLI